MNECIKLNMAQVNLSVKQIHRHGEQTCGCQEGGGGSGMYWELGVNRCRLLPLEWIRNEIHSTRDYVWSLMMEHDNVRKKERIPVYVTGSQCCIVEN